MIHSLILYSNASSCILRSSVVTWMFDWNQLGMMSLSKWMMPPFSGAYKHNVDENKIHYIIILDKSQADRVVNVTSFTMHHQSQSLFHRDWIVKRTIADDFYWNSQHRYTTTSMWGEIWVTFLSSKPILCCSFVDGVLYMKLYCIVYH